MLLGSARILGGWALQGYFAVGYCRDAWWLGTAGTLGGWALQGHLVAGHCSHQAPGGGRGQHRRQNLTNPMRGWGIIERFVRVLSKRNRESESTILVIS